MAKIIDFEKEFLKRHPDKRKILATGSIEKISQNISQMIKNNEIRIKNKKEQFKMSKSTTRRIKKYFFALGKKNPNIANSLMHEYFLVCVNFSERINVLSEGFFQLYNKGNRVSSLIILRSIVETLAMFFFFISKVEVHIKKKNWQMVSAIIDRQLYGSRTEHSLATNLLQLKPYHINDALEYAFKHNNKKTYKLYYKKDAFHLMPFEFIKKSDYDILSELVHPVSPYKHNISEDFSLIDSIAREDVIKRFLYIDYYDELIHRTSDCIGVNVILTYVAEITMELLIEK